MLKLNKLEKQTISPKPKQYNLCEQLCWCVFQFEDLSEKKNIALNADIEERVDINADAGFMDLVWTNIFTNAVKFTPEGGSITLQEISDHRQITVCVTDTGCVMDADTQKHIFEKFYQCDASHATEGNGLGLALALRILQLSDGIITVDSEPGKGTCSTVTLPKALQSKEEE